MRESHVLPAQDCPQFHNILPQHLNNITISPPQHDYASEVFSEIDCRAGIPSSLRARANQLFHQAKFAFRTTANIDLILTSILQAYSKRRIFISYFHLREFYTTQASDSILNNLHFKLVSKKNFEYTPSFNMNEIVDTVFLHFRIRSVCTALVVSNYNKINTTQRI